MRRRVVGRGGRCRCEPREEITRRYLAEMEMPKAEEVEMPEDDTVEPLPETLDLGVVIAEALALALPPFPRAEGATLGEAVFTEPGATPMTDDAAMAATNSSWNRGSVAVSGRVTASSRIWRRHMCSWPRLY